MIDPSQMRTVIDFPLVLGESPVWDPVAQVLWFVDLQRPAIFRLQPDTGQVARFDMSQIVTTVALAPAGRLLLTLRSGAYLFDPATRRFEFLVHPEPDRPGNRLNEGRVGPDGALWIGSMFEHRPYQPAGALYRLSPAGDVRIIRDGVHVSNGLAWSPDGRTMYHADSVIPEVRAYVFDPGTGETPSYRLFTALDPALGYPDGAAVDVEGCYWSAGVTAGRLNRISPEGRLLASWPLPIARPTMPCFGGQDMRTLFLTSLRHEDQAGVQDGTLVSFASEVAGLASSVFGVPIHSSALAVKVGTGLAMSECAK